jgi:NhaP-type Na+/H+ or K+/H+ antiporter
VQIKQEPSQSPNFFAVVLSVIAALFGVQTEHNRQRDFQHGKPALYIAIGVVFIVLFVVTLLMIVNWVLP